MKVKSESEVAQSCPTLCDARDCSPPGSSVNGIFQARVLEWGAIAFSEYMDGRFANCCTIPKGVTQILPRGERCRRRPRQGGPGRWGPGRWGSGMPGEYLLPSNQTADTRLDGN